jgi:hypothetical protein
MARREYDKGDKDSTYHWTVEKYKNARSIGVALGLIAKAKNIGTVCLWDFTAGVGVDDRGNPNVLLNTIAGFHEARCTASLRVVAVEEDKERHLQLVQSLQEFGYSDFVETRCGLFSEVVLPGEVSGWGAVLFDPVPDKFAISDTDDLVRLAGNLDIVSYWSLTNLKRLKMTADKWLSQVTVGSRNKFLWNDPPVGEGSNNSFQWAWLWATNAELNGPFGGIKKLNRAKNQKWLNTNRMQGVQLSFKF